jgi:hypothetical protein
VTTRDYFLAPPPPHDGNESATDKAAQISYDRQQSARDPLSLAWHALDADNYSAAREAVEQALFWIRALGAARRSA